MGFENKMNNQPGAQPLVGEPIVDVEQQVPVPQAPDVFDEQIGEEPVGEEAKMPDAPVPGPDGTMFISPEYKAARDSRRASEAITPVSFVADQEYVKAGGARTEASVSELMPEGPAKGIQEEGRGVEVVTPAMKQSAEDAIRQSGLLEELLDVWNNEGATPEEKIKAFARFKDEAFKLASDNGIVTQEAFMAIPVLRNLALRDNGHADEYQRQEYELSARAKREGSAQIIRDALEEVADPEWQNKSVAERRAFLEEQLRSATRNAPAQINELPETEKIKAAIAGLVAEADAVREKRGMPTRLERKGFFASIGAIPSRVRNFFRERKEHAVELRKEQELATAFDRTIVEYNNSGTVDLVGGLKKRIAIVEEFLVEAERIYGSIDNVKNERARRIYKEAIDTFAQDKEDLRFFGDKKAQDAQSQESEIKEAELAVPHVETAPTEETEPTLTQAPEEVSEGEEGDEEGDPVAQERAEEQVATPAPEEVAPATIDTAPDQAAPVDVPAVEVPSFTPAAEVAPTKEEAAPVVSRLETTAPAFENSENAKERFSASLKRAFRRLQESRVIDGKVQQIESGDAYRRFNKFLDEETAGQAIDGKVRVEVLQETFDRETRSAPRVILGMALRDWGVTVKMKDGELGKFKRREKKS